MATLAQPSASPPPLNNHKPQLDPRLSSSFTHAFLDAIFLNPHSFPLGIILLCKNLKNRGENIYRTNCDTRPLKWDFSQLSMTSRSLRSSLLNLVLHKYTLLLKFNYVLYYLALLTNDLWGWIKVVLIMSTVLYNSGFFRLFQFSI